MRGDALSRLWSLSLGDKGWIAWPRVHLVEKVIANTGNTTAVIERVVVEHPEDLRH